jgi:hypothetical protein
LSNLVERLESVVQELVPLTGSLSLESLRDQLGAAGASDHAGGP